MTRISVAEAVQTEPSAKQSALKSLGTGKAVKWLKVPCAVRVSHVPSLAKKVSTQARRSKMHVSPLGHARACVAGVQL